jgi:hypothetical protein
MKQIGWIAIGQAFLLGEVGTRPVHERHEKVVETRVGVSCITGSTNPIEEVSRDSVERRLGAGQWVIVQEKWARRDETIQGLCAFKQRRRPTSQVCNNRRARRAWAHE